MRMSCNGCRVLRKGCSGNCSIRPCLEWIKTPLSQANATVFLAKFYGRAGLINLLNAASDNLRPEIFRSLLYEACGRIVNPTCGSVGLMWSGNWQLCQNAVEAVLNGDPITQIASDSADTNIGPPLKAYDIRHIPKDENSSGSNDIRRVRTRGRFKRTPAKIVKASRVSSGSGKQSGQDSSLSHQCESLASVATVEASAVFGAEPESTQIELELYLGLEPASRLESVNIKKDERAKIGCLLDGEDCMIELGLA